MEPLAAILLILGCSDDLSSCHQVAAPQPVYSSVAECETNLADAMGQHLGDFPQILAQCLPTGEPQATRVSWNVTPEGHLLASAEIVPDYLAQLDIQANTRN